MPADEPLAKDGAEEPRHYSDLGAVLDTALAMLVEGAEDRLAPAHTPTLATVGLDGTAQARTVVLRGFERSCRMLRIHTDSRSGKIRELAANPRAAVHLYDASRKVQLRLSCIIKVHKSGPLWDDAWDGTRPMSRVCYQVTAPPGNSVENPAAAVFSSAETQDGAQHFAMLEARVDAVEWLYLSARGHRRARFEWNRGGWHGTWLVP